MDSKNYKEGQSMQRPPLFEANCFIYWKNRFETYVKSKDIDIWHIMVNGIKKPTIKKKDTAKEEIIPYDKLEEVHKKMLSKNDEAKMVLYNALPKKEFNIIITSIKAFDESFSSPNHVRKFLRALPTKWRLKVTAIEESKDLSTLRVDELIEELSKGKRREEREGRAKMLQVCDSEEEDNSTKDEICLMALENNEIESLSLKLSKFENSSHFLQEMIENQRSQKDKKGLGFTEDRASTSEAKTEKLGQEVGKMPFVEPAEPVPSARELACTNTGNRPPAEVYENLDSNVIKRTRAIQITKRSVPSVTIENVIQTVTTHNFHHCILY
ncbi:hypothetical protein Tco_0456269 [Tanacetum coccineum]